MKRNSHTRLALSILVLAGIATGCIGYTLGTTLPKNLRSVNVPTFANKTDKPLIEVEATQFTLQELQNDGTLKLTTPENADTILEVTLTKYSIEPLRYDNNAGKTALEYRQNITASFVFKRKNKVNGKESILTGPLERTGTSTFVITGDLPGSEKQALVNTSKDLGHLIVSAVVELW